jgi:DNA-binding CsgD family transcriptional regulator
MRQQSKSVAPFPESHDPTGDALEFEQIAQRRAGPGIMLFTSSAKLLYQDREAWALCAEMRQQGGKSTRSFLPPRVLELCNEVKKQLHLRTHAKDWEQFRIKHVLTDFQRPVLVSGVGLPNPANPDETQILITMEVIGRSKNAIFEHSKERFHLTQREVTVVEHLFKGWTNKEIGNSLGVTEQTIKEHIKHIMEKTKTTTRTGILVQLLRL